MLKHIYSSTHTQSIEAVHVTLLKLGQTAVAGQAYWFVQLGGVAMVSAAVWIELNWRYFIMVLLYMKDTYLNFYLKGTYLEPSGYLDLQ